MGHTEFFFRLKLRSRLRIGAAVVSSYGLGGGSRLSFEFWCSQPGQGVDAALSSHLDAASGSIFLNRM